MVEGLCNWADALPEEVDPRDLEEGGLDGVEPEEGLMGWVEGVTEKVSFIISHSPPTPATLGSSLISSRASERIFARRAFDSN